MMKSLYCLRICLFSFTGFSQQPIYKEFEVDSVATPKGGMEYINVFLQTNLRKPIQAESEGVGGRVLVQGVVEPDGHISEVKLLKSLRPDLDREALRVFRLFNAWKPAQKGGTAVRQQVMYPVVFVRNTPFLYADGKRITLYGADQKLTTDSATAKYKQAMPVDSNGIPNGDMVVYEHSRRGWNEVNKLPLVREKAAKYGPANSSAELIGYRNGNNLWFDYVYGLDKGILFRKTLYDNGRIVGSPQQFHDNGVAMETDYVDGGRTFLTSWYPNGQIRQVQFREDDPSGKGSAYQIVNYWTPDGKQQVIDGNGKAVFTFVNPSKTDSTKQTRYVEQGEYVYGKKQGLWTGHYDDNSYDYEELYDKGVLQSGKSHRGENAPAAYTTIEKQPEFQGGMQGLGQFLANNLRYPPDAQRAGQQGQVFVSFVVCTDGTLCDYEVIKGVSPTIDQEALRVVKTMSGRWKPGVQRGEPVRVKYNLPLNFSLR